jgi:hypothetical protein
VDKYDLDVLRQHATFDYNIALEITSEIVLLELIHRIVVCIFEVCIVHSEHTITLAYPTSSLTRFSKILFLTHIWYSFHAVTPFEDRAELKDVSE